MSPSGLPGDAHKKGIADPQAPVLKFAEIGEFL
jgi:hypothetical protein